MNNENMEINRNNLNHRRKRIQSIKMCIITIFIILLLLPTILCLFLFTKINSLEKEVQVLKVLHDDEYGAYSNAIKSSNKDTIAHAAEKAVDMQDKTKSEEVSKKEIEKDSIEEDPLDIKIEDNKKVYLTFDDGPSIYTEKILDILKEYQIKATFFVIGKSDSYSKEMYQRIVDEGHTLGMHSYSHQYENIYNSLEDFKKDFNQLSDLLYEITGVRPSLYRFPGGSSNQVSKVDMSQYIRYLNDKNITYFDWNVVNGDATGEEITTDGLVENILTGIKNKDVSVVLMHDSPTKINTVDSLPKLIRELEKQDCSILPIDQNTVSVQHVTAESIK